MATKSLLFIGAHRQFDSLIHGDLPKYVVIFLIMATKEPSIKGERRSCREATEESKSKLFLNMIIDKRLLTLYEMSKGRGKLKATSS